jgi:hypothetical protein
VADDKIHLSSKLTLVCRGACHQQPHLLVFQKAKHSFEEHCQFFLVVFIAGAFAESHPLLLICQIGQISCGISSFGFASILLMLG